MQNPIRVRHRWFAITMLAVLIAALCVRAEHHESWIEIKSPHFTAYSNGTETEGRQVAVHFEEIRALFEQSFPNLRVDSGDKPTILYALKNEDSFKLFIPGYGQGKDPTKLCGVYRTAIEKNFALVRTDSGCLATSPSSNNSPQLVRGMFMNQVNSAAAHPFKPIYHEYAHGLFRLNFRGLPLWLDEGLAEYWGNSDISSKQARVGQADAAQVALLKQGPLLPIEKLVSIDASSPFYNTQNHAGIFYAESWALVHYLLMSPDVRGQDLLTKFLAALQATDDPIEAASKTFGDLSKLGEKLEAYCRQLSFYVGQVPLHISTSDKDYSARRLSPAEGLVRQADYLLHANHSPEAIELLHQAAGLDPDTQGLHDALGYYHYLKNDRDNAEKEFDLALAADPGDAIAYFYKAQILHRKLGYSDESTPLIRTNLEKLIALRPDFAPAHAFLCIAYVNSPVMGAKAVQQCQRAMSLEPGNFNYFTDYGRALVADGKLDDAKMVADRAQKSAIWPQERSRADALARELNAKIHSSSAVVTTLPGEKQEQPGVQVRVTREVEGQITELICAQPPSVRFTLAALGEQILLRVTDIAQIEIHESQGGPAAAPPDCAKWKDRRARVTFTAAPDAVGEVKIISFE